MKIRVKLTKPWGEYRDGAVVRFDEAKGRRVIAAGYGYEVKEKKKAAPRRRGRPKAQTATRPKAPEQADNPPELSTSSESDSIKMMTGSNSTYDEE